MAGDQATLSVRADDGTTVVRAAGDWTAATVGAVDADMRRLAAEIDVSKAILDVSDLGLVDTAGAYAMSRVLGPDAPLERLRGDHEAARELILLVCEGGAACAPREPEVVETGFMAVLERAGRGLEAAWGELLSTLAFFGEMLFAMARAVANPGRVRWASTVHVMEQTGLNALPIVATLSFFVGAVVAYLGASLLQQFGASVFAVELVAFSVLREFGVIITAILLAGRSDSAFTAQIGSMRMQQEVDAMQAMGLDPFDVLVVPRVIACVAMAPLLTFGAMMMGLLGGMMVLWGVLDVSPGFFIARISENIPPRHFWAGMAKAPVFALIIAVIGCRQGLEVGRDVETLGRRVTAAVVQSIFMVIVIDAVFAMIYLELDI